MWTENMDLDRDTTRRVAILLNPYSSIADIFHGEKILGRSTGWRLVFP